MNQPRQVPAPTPSSHHGLSQDEVRALLHQLRERRITRNVNQSFAERLTFGQRMSDGLARAAGSWAFILGFSGILAAWVLINARLLAKPFDPFPFILLNLILSTLAALQAPIIMMSQNRQAAKDRLQADHDYEINLKAEAEIAGLHLKLDALRETQWHELLQVQQEQIGMLQRLVARLAEENGD
ncbi:MAG: DUF1003 domain-containing protein [Caldilineae bacterium]|nr:DUF1003 domain-containing protein [Caldilineae bacterium]